MGNLVRTPEMNLVGSVDAGSISLGVSDTLIKFNEGSAIGNIILASDVTGFTVNSTNLGLKDVRLIHFNPTCPCEECDIDLGITTKKKFMSNGEYDDSIDTRRLYEAVLPSLTEACTNGLMGSADAEIAKRSIIEQINIDNTDPRGEQREPLLYAYNSVKLTGAGASTNISVDINSNTYAGAGANQAARIADLIANINAGTDAIAYAGPTTGEVIILKADYDYVVDSVTGATLSTDSFIGFEAYSAHQGFTLEFEDNVGTQEVVQAGVKPTLDQKHMNQLFPIKREDVARRPSGIPLQGVDYYMYEFVSEVTAYGSHYSNEIVGKQCRVKLFVPKSLADSANWNGKLNTWAANFDSSVGWVDLPTS